jgi:hypothetical protein
VDGFGKKLTALQDALRLDGPTIAVNALGPKSTKNQRRDFASYLSRVKRGRVDNPALEFVSRAARGFGFPDLASFFRALEAPAELRPPAKTSTTPKDPDVRGGTPTISEAGDRALAILVDYLTDVSVRAGTAAGDLAQLRGSLTAARAEPPDTGGVRDSLARPVPHEQRGLK